MQAHTHMHVSANFAAAKSRADFVPSLQLMYLVSSTGRKPLCIVAPGPTGQNGSSSSKKLTSSITLRLVWPGTWRDWPFCSCSWLVAVMQGGVDCLCTLSLDAADSSTQLLNHSCVACCTLTKSLAFSSMVHSFVHWLIQYITLPSLTPVYRACGHLLHANIWGLPPPLIHCKTIKKADNPQWQTHQKQTLKSPRP